MSDFATRQSVIEHIRGKGSFANLSLDGMDLSGMDFSGLDLSKCDLSNTVLANAMFRNANITGATFRSARIVKTDFSGASGDGADFEGTYLDTANFSNAGLRNTSFHDSRGLRSANFSGAKLDSAWIPSRKTDLTVEVPTPPINRPALLSRRPSPRRVAGRGNSLASSRF